MTNYGLLGISSSGSDGRSDKGPLCDVLSGGRRIDADVTNRPSSSN